MAVYGVMADTRQALTLHQLASLQRAFQGVDGILHAGPVGDLKVVEQLQTLAPARAVCGNAEHFIVRSELYVRLSWKVGPVKVGLIHGYGKPHGLKRWLLHQFEEDPVDVIVYGRNYEPLARPLAGTFFFNPGSFSGGLPEGARGKGPCRVGLLYIRGKKVEGQPGIVLPP